MLVSGRLVATRASAAASAAAPAQPEARPRIATFGIPDLNAHEAALRDQEGQTARRRRDEYERGRMTDFSGKDISRRDPSRF